MELFAHENPHAREFWFVMSCGHMTEDAVGGRPNPLLGMIVDIFNDVPSLERTINDTVRQATRGAL